jgi:hypothetical protein
MRATAMIRPHNMLTALLCASVVTLGACKKDGDANDNAMADSARVDTTTVGGTTMAEPAVRVADIDMGRAVNEKKEIMDKTDDFRPTETIYASVHTKGTGSGTLVARWLFEDGQLVEEQSQALAAADDARTEFHINKSTGFPKGKYTIKILMDGKELDSKDFKVE